MYSPRCCNSLAIPVVEGPRHVILETPVASIEARERQRDVALALVGGVVHGDQQPLAAGPCQAKARKQSQVQLPSQAGRAFEQLPWPSRTAGCRSTASSRS